MDFFLLLPFGSKVLSLKIDFALFLINLKLNIFTLASNAIYERFVYLVTYFLISSCSCLPLSSIFACIIMFAMKKNRRITRHLQLLWPTLKTSVVFLFSMASISPTHLS